VGQYYKVINVTKRQYLHPHKFGAGLKLMEFSGQRDSIGQALILLTCNGNNRGGGDLRTDDPLIGSWAGDQIVVAGDYGDEWKWIPEDLKGKEYEYEQEVIRKFGFKEDGITPSDENLYHAASLFFEDISDKIIEVVAKADSPYHPWAAMDLDDDGWRDYPLGGVLPKETPKKPAGGKQAWLKYKAQAVPYEETLITDIQHYLRRYPEKKHHVLQQLRELQEEMMKE
jgi:hypothetical protein